MDRFFLTLFCVFISNAAIAENGERLERIAQLCIAERAVGFNWEKNEYVSANFKPEQYTLTLVDQKKPLTEKEAFFMKVAGCQANDKPTLDTPGFRGYKSCARLSTLGEDRSQYLSCDQFHQKTENGVWWVRMICGTGIKRFSVTLNERFHYSNVHDDTRSNPENSNKDSIYLTVGRCSSVLN